jgi:single-stranded DNA-binding protein
MPYLNEAFFMGHVGGSPETSVTTNGKEYRRFSVAVSRGRDKQGNEYGTDWFNVTVWGDKPWIEEIKKGDLVLVVGRIEVNQKDEKTFVNVIANRVLRLREKLSNYSDDTNEQETANHEEETEVEYIPPETGETPKDDQPPF